MTRVGGIVFDHKGKETHPRPFKKNTRYKKKTLKCNLQSKGQKTDVMRGVYATDMALKSCNEMNKDVRWQVRRRFEYENVGHNE